MHHDALSLTAWLGIAAGAITLAGVLVAGWSAWISVSNERKRTQPIVVAHEEHGRRFTEDGRYFAVGGYMTNEASGHAFNVRFGVELDGVRYPQKLRADDPDSGNVQRILRPGERRPTEGSCPILIPHLSLLGGEDDPDPGRVYWARYENARNQTWETLNPWDALLVSAYGGSAGCDSASGRNSNVGKGRMSAGSRGSDKRLPSFAPE